MCGRYAITLPPEAIRAWFAYREMPNFPPRYNVAPTQPIPIVTRDPERRDADRHFKLVRWGFVPGFVKDFSRFPLIINARAEEILAKPSFRAAMIRRRCLVIADGYYEWHRPAPRQPGTPFLFRRTDGRPIGFAGLWEGWMGADGSEMETACIVTIAAGGPSAAIHPRMPVILEAGDFDTWLDGDAVTPARAAALLRPAGAAILRIDPIGPAVNTVSNDDPSIQAPIGAPMEPRRDAQGDLF